MDKLNFVRDGGRKLPPGFRFEPTDEEIVFQYLSRKTFSHPLPALVIPEFDVFSMDPWHLPGDSEQDMYFFCNVHRCEEQSKRATPSGFWKATASSKHINASKRMPILGIRNSLVFYKYSANNLRAVRTDWAMHQYCIALSQHNSQNNSLVRIGDWSLCRIFLKQQSTTTEVDEDRKRRNNDHFSTVDMISGADSSSDSSSSPNFDPNIFSEVSSKGTD